jgi:hypothetical protein
VGKITSKSNGDEVLSNESLSKSNSNKAFYDDSLLKKIVLMKH